MGGILEGIRVLDLGRGIAAPFCAMLLADMGAEVITVEKPGNGYGRKTLGPFKNGKTLYHPLFTRNKKSLGIDMYSEEGKEILTKLIEKSDVLVQNFRPGTMKKMGFPYEKIKELNPGLIMVNISMYGQYGPLSPRVGMEWIGQAMSGLMSVNGTKETGPILCGTCISDQITALYSAFGAMVGLVQRIKTKKGLYIDSDLLGNMVSISQYYIPDYSANGIVHKQVGNLDPLVAPSNCYKAKNGNVFIHVGAGKRMKEFAKTIGDPRLMKDEFLSSEYNLKHRGEIDAIISEWVATQTVEEVEKKMTDISIPVGIVNGMDKVVTDEHFLERGTIVDIEVPEVGPVPYAGRALKFPDLEPPEYRSMAAVGEHNEELLCGLLGMSQEKFNKLKEKKII